MQLRAFVDEVEGDDHTLVVCNRTQPRPVLELLEATFPADAVTVDEASVPDGDEDVVALVTGGEVVATSPLSALTEQLLYVNSDLFITGTRPMEEVDLPDVLLELDDVPMELRGYPESDREKLVLVAISRLVERRAAEVGVGTLRTSFQQLSRIEDEVGTRSVYERLAATDVDVHLYGEADELPPLELRTVVHAARGKPLSDAWFVVYTPPDDASASAAEAAGPAALLAIEEQPRTWRGFWTFDPERVRRLNRHVERTL